MCKSFEVQVMISLLPLVCDVTPVKRRHLLKFLFVGWLLNVPATCESISGTDLLDKFTH